MSDEELLRRYVQQRDPTALAEIVRRYGGMVLGVARRVTGHPQDAEDVTQTCFAELLQKAGEVKVSLPGYLHCLATRRAIDLVRRRMARRVGETAAACSDETVDQLWFEVKADLDSAMSDLDDSIRVPLVEHYLLGRTQAEIAEGLQVNQSTVARRLAAGLEELRKRLGGSAAIAPDAAILTAAMAKHGASHAPEAFVTAMVAKLAAAQTVAGVAGTVAVGSTLGAMVMKKALIVTVIVIAGTATVAVVATKPANQQVSAPTTKPLALPSRAQEQAFYRAVDGDDLEVARRLLAGDTRLAGAHSGERGETPLHHAVSVAMAQLLLDAGADPNARDREYGARPVRWAINQWRPEVAKLLEQKAGSDDDICYCCATGNTQKLAAILEKDPQAAKTPTSKEILGSNRSLLHVAAQYGQSGACEMLLKNGADIAAEGGFFNAQPLENAAWAGFTDTVKVLVQHGANVNAEVKSSEGIHTAIWWAALTGRKEIVTVLLDAGATVEPGLIDAVRRTQQQPYPGRALPPRQDYDAVIELLQKHEAGE